jgi:hypothetical protein
MNRVDLSGKRILFIGPIFHTYHSAIIQELQSRGAIVIFFAERKYGLAYRFVNNFRNQQLAAYQARHYEWIQAQTKSGQFDYLFVIRGFGMPVAFLEEFRKLHPQAELIMYQWDSQKDNPFVHLVSHFDKSYSFDFADVNAHRELEYLALFYTSDVMEAVKGEASLLEYDFFFMGWYKPERYEAIIRFRKFSNKHGRSLKAFVYLPFSTFVKALFKGIILDPTVISFRKMGRKEYLSILHRSKAVVDVSSRNQTGMAMRIVEAAAAGKVIITNNGAMKQDPLFREGKVVIFDDLHPEVDLSVLDHAGQPGRCKEIYSLHNWVDYIFSWEAR